ncbi:hypothetical protein NEDG_00594 [Nematocida displodere]|uniref:Uncharacterized protein n=1 Tax=Nematocida displodere TaxID=1805483 RepID=A0A177ED58_9MICR|nr:hypothetical protein NEDG_00594 [Nematocida displodere]
MIGKWAKQSIGWVLLGAADLGLVCGACIFDNPCPFEYMDSEKPFASVSPFYVSDFKRCKTVFGYASVSLDDPISLQTFINHHNHIYSIGGGMSITVDQINDKLAGTDLEKQAALFQSRRIVMDEAIAFFSRGDVCKKRRILEFREMDLSQLLGYYGRSNETIKNLSFLNVKYIEDAEHLQGVAQNHNISLDETGLLSLLKRFSGLQTLSLNDCTISFLSARRKSDSLLALKLFNLANSTPEVLDTLLLNMNMHSLVCLGVYRSQVKKLSDILGYIGLENMSQLAYATLIFDQHLQEIDTMGLEKFEHLSRIMVKEVPPTATISPDAFNGYIGKKLCIHLELPTYTALANSMMQTAKAASEFCFHLARQESETFEHISKDNDLKVSVKNTSSRYNGAAASMKVVLRLHSVSVEEIHRILPAILMPAWGSGENKPVVLWFEFFKHSSRHETHTRYVETVKSLSDRAGRARVSLAVVTFMEPLLVLKTLWLISCANRDEYYPHLLRVEILAHVHCSIYYNELADLEECMACKDIRVVVKGQNILVIQFLTAEEKLANTWDVPDMSYDRTVEDFPTFYYRQSAPPHRPNFLCTIV